MPEELDPQIVEGLDRICKAAEEFEKKAIENDEYLTSLILYLLHKHRYQQITISRQELQKIKDAQDLALDMVNDQVTLSVVNKPIRFDDFKLTLPEHAKAIDPNVV